MNNYFLIASTVWILLCYMGCLLFWILDKYARKSFYSEDPCCKLDLMFPSLWAYTSAGLLMILAQISSFFWVDFTFVKNLLLTAADSVCLGMVIHVAVNFAKARKARKEWLSQSLNIKNRQNRKL